MSLFSIPSNNPIIEGRHQFYTMYTNDRTTLYNKIEEFQTIINEFFQNIDAMEENKRVRKQNPFQLSYGNQLQKGGIVAYDEIFQRFIAFSNDDSELSPQRKNEIIKRRIEFEIKKKFSNSMGQLSTNKITLFLLNKLENKNGSQTINLSPFARPVV